LELKQPSRKAWRPHENCQVKPWHPQRAAFKHICKNGSKGTQFKELERVSPSLSRIQLKVLVRELQQSGAAYAFGKNRTNTLVRALTWNQTWNQLGTKNAKNEIAGKK